VVEAVTRAVALAVFRRQRQVPPSLDEGVARVLVATLGCSAQFDTTRRRFPMLELVLRDLWDASLRALLDTITTENR
jgi:hypothetical protein